ncbi:mitochondrial resolvase Ydc2 [Parachaetomium inaequale]|uniref:Mitochondrial resolvase Ydc2 n=1 Tax=Parachaetomium inaequale TaxID=2588326 RepID=A0AAN6SSB4_9PEZI|nr:mitochondrial resolvase Ydc2 [Parachaetomium inaequale]
MTTNPLLSETALTLKTLCSSCGLSKTGPKRVLVQRLRHAARHFQPVSPSARILSIDLGLKNFAFTLLTPAPQPRKQQPPQPTPNSNNDNSPLTSPIRLHAWHRLDLTQPSIQPLKPTKYAPTSHQEEEKQEEEEEEDPYSPPALAALTTSLIKTHLLPLRPTHVLIERQRFRTGGAAAIFEWTLRVNSLEAMLHAAFAALRGNVNDVEGGWGTASGGRVESVLPRAVAGFLFPAEAAEAGGVDGGEGGEEKKGKKGGAAAAYHMLKREKVDMLGGFLAAAGGGGGLVVPEKGQAREMVRLFLAGVERRREGKRRSGKRKGVGVEAGGKEVEEVVDKMDDLSDAVLQGMVWLQWQRNLEALIKERPELLEEE